MDVKQLIENSDLNISKDKILYNEPMKEHTSFKIGGPADCYIKIDNIKDLKEIIIFARNKKIPLTILGNGSNVLISDKGIRGIVLNIRLNKIEIMNYGNKIYATIGAGIKLSILSHLLLKNSITGFEELSGIPGTIGGAIKMNAGAHGKEIKDVLYTVRCIDYDGNIKEFQNEEMKFAYRTSMLKENKYIVLETTLIFHKGKKEEIKQKMQEYADYRKEKQPIEYPSAGSTFKRGEDFITAKLIDEAGLKGKRIGDAEISTKHAGFIINKGNATSDDVLELVKYVKEEINKKFNKDIELEIEVIGE